jgi:hypothetical protein
MKDLKFKKLMQAARNELPPEAPFNFSQRVVSAIRKDEQTLAPLSILDQLAQMFPRLAWAAVIIIGLCVATDFYLNEKEAPLSVTVEQATEEWLFAAK